MACFEKGKQTMDQGQANRQPKTSSKYRRCCQANAGAVNHRTEYLHVTLGYIPLCLPIPGRVAHWICRRTTAAHQIRASL
jgi:hypothetical protein